jgi:hypothetical protein
VGIFHGILSKHRSMWHMQIRRQGSPALKKTFKDKVFSYQWVRRIERGLNLIEVTFNPNISKAMYLYNILVRQMYCV